MVNRLNGKLPLHELLSFAEAVAALLPAYKNAVNVADENGMLPVHYAAVNDSLQILQMVAEENLSNLSVVSSIYGFVAYCAMAKSRPDNRRYIHSVVPDILSVNIGSDSMLHEFYTCSWSQDSTKHSVVQLDWISCSISFATVPA